MPVSDLRITRFDSGLTVATECVPEALSVAAGAWVGVGSRDEPVAVGGVSHFLEHLLFKGTAQRSAQAISRAVDRVGGDFNAFTSREYTAYYCRVPARHGGLAIDLLGDVLVRPALRDDDVRSERNVILEELAMDDDTLDDVAHRVFAERVFQEHPLGRDPAGTRSTVMATTADDVRSFFADHYGASAMVVSIAGPYPHDEMLTAVERAFAEADTSAVRPVRFAPGEPGGDAHIDADSEQVHIVLGGRALARDDHRRDALDVVNHVLGGGLSSRLFEEIREQRGLAYAVYSATSGYADAGAYQLYAGTQPEQTDEVIGLLHGELRRLVEGGISDEELDIAKGSLTGSFQLGLEDCGARMARNGGLLITTGEVPGVDEQLAKWEAVDHAAVRDVIAEVYRPAPIMVTVGSR